VIVAKAPSWTLSQVVALIVGVLYVVLGGAALLRTGLDLDLLRPTVTVAGLAYNPLFGLIELFVGLLLLVSGAFPRAVESVVFVGVLAIAFGFVLVIEPMAFQESVAAARAHGWFYVFTGSALAISAIAAPAVSRWVARRNAGGSGGGRTTTETQVIDRDGSRWG
jgi:hypothetical protein